MDSEALEIKALAATRCAECSGTFFSVLPHGRLCPLTLPLPKRLVFRSWVEAALFLLCTENMALSFGCTPTGDVVSLYGRLVREDSAQAMQTVGAERHCA